MNIQWYPGHMTKTRRMIEADVKLVDAVCEILDARIPLASRNPDIDTICGTKPRMIILNRIDMADPAMTKRWAEHFRAKGYSVLQTDCKTKKGISGFVPAVRELLAEKLARYAEKGQVGRPLKLMIVGIPNVGKSTLLNRLLNEERAMVSEIAGTTRDVIEECANIGGVLFRFLDTAGIRPTDDRLEQMGIQRTMSSIERARIVIHMVDASTLTGPVPAPDFPLRPGQKLLTVVNKTDKAPAAWRLPEGVVGISAKHGEGIDALCDALRESVDTEALYHGDPVVSNSRHYEALSAAREALGQALDGLAHGLPTDLLSEEIRQVITHLSAITGRGAIAPDEILQNIFSKFCIGK